MKKTEDACYGEWRATTLTSQLSLSTIGELGRCSLLVPILCMNFINAITAWVQHAFCSPERPEDYFASSSALYLEMK